MAYLPLPNAANFSNVSFFINGSLLESTVPVHGMGFVESKWNQLLDVIGDDPDVLYVWFLVTYTYSLFWLVGLLFTAMDLTGRPRALRKYKIQPGTNEPLSVDRFWHLVRVVLRNQFGFGIPTAYLIYSAARLIVTEVPPVRVLPAPWIIVRDLAVCVLTWEIGYYYTHRLLHHGSMYRRFHKQHHEWRSPVALSAMYSHPVEFVLSDLLPVYIGPALMQCHVFTIALWFTYVMVDTLVDHSDYHLPFLASSEFHDYHHFNFNQCFGNSGLWDLVHGTAKEFLRKKQFQRHYRLLSFRSAREAIPDKET